MPSGGARIGAGRPKGGGVARAHAKPKSPRKRKESSAVLPADDRDRCGKTPLEHMLDLMNDPLADEKLRAQMAVAAAPYVHGKIGEGGKKDAKADAAKKASGGRLSPTVAPPLKLVGRGARG